jgi:hypothetical protein
VRTAADVLSDAYTRAEPLIAERDADTPAMISGSHPASSSEPWNVQAAYAVTTIHEGVRRLDESLTRQVTGRPRRVKRGGSEQNTALAIKAIADLGESVGAHRPCPHTPRHRRCCCDSCRVCRIVNRWANGALLCKGLDEGVQWSPIPGDPPCPYCETFSLRVAERLYVIACHNPECSDSDGNAPLARLGPAPRTQQAAVLWNDGLVT